MPIRVPAKAGKPYRPSNGTEGLRFEEEFCDQCKMEPECGILLNAQIYEIGEPGYPEEWKFDDEGIPLCTAFARKSSKSPKRPRT